MTQRPRIRPRGFTVLETVIGLAVTTIVVALAFDGGRLPGIAATKSLDRLQSTRACATALERIDRSTLSSGERTFAPNLPGTVGTVVLRELSPTLFEATATVIQKDGTRISTATRLVKEGGR